MNTTEFYGKEKISRILLKLARPVMIAQLIQALYNIVDSLKLPLKKKWKFFSALLIRYFSLFISLS